MTPPTTDTEPLREALAALEHDQWIEWSRTVAEQGLTPERLARWERYWVPYADLDEPTKDHDRVWADKVLAALAAERASGGLDEEALNTAILDELAELWGEPSDFVSTQVRPQVARSIVARYARLATPQPGEDR